MNFSQGGFIGDCHLKDQAACGVEKATDTDLARSSIEAHQKELAAEIAKLSGRLTLVLRQDSSNSIATESKPSPPPTTATHGWLCEQRDGLREHTDVLRSLNQRLEV